MNKRLIISTMLVLTCLSLNAQVFKLVGGFSTYSYSQNESKQKSSMVPAIGFGFDSEFASERAMITTDFWMSYHNQDLNTAYQTRYFDFLKINCDLLFKYKFKKYSSPYVFFGGSVGVIMPRETDANGDKLYEENPLDMMWDYGPVIGAGMEILLSDTYSISVDGRYRFGVAELKLDGIKLKNKSLFMVLALKF